MEKTIEKATTDIPSKSFKALNKRFDEITKKYKISAIILPLILYFIYFLTYEAFFAFSLFSTQNGFEDMLYFTKISIAASLIVPLILWLLPKKLQAVMFPISAAVCILYASAQICVVKSNGSFFRLVNLLTGKNAMQFADSVLGKIALWYYIGAAVFFLISIAIAIIVQKKAAVPEIKPLKRAKLITGIAAALICTTITVMHEPLDDLSHLSYVYKNFTDTNTVYDQSDLYTYIVHDAECTFTNRIRAKRNIAMIDEYFANKPEHTDNDMTGVFADKNLLVIQLESFENYLIDDAEVCPNLNRIRSESIVFENYYGMRFGAEPTMGNELAVNTGLYAISDYNASTDLLKAYFPYSLANMFSREKGYEVNVYHENGAYFYHRDKIELAFGYEKYNSFRDMTDEDIVYEDDYVLAACDDLYEAFTGGDDFMRYFIGFSTHPPYNADGDFWSAESRYDAAIERHPELAAKNTNNEREVYEVYATMTDDMVGLLLERMEEDGRLDDTVILFVADHANLSSLDENKGADYFNVQNLPCFLYPPEFRAADGQKGML